MITNPNNSVYIGQSVNIYQRFAAYRCLGCKNQAKLYRSLKKYGVENHSFEITLLCEKEDLDVFEKGFIRLYKSNNRNGLNLTDGGANAIPCEETRKKLSESHKGINTWMKGRKLTEEHKKNISLGGIGREGYWKGKVGHKKGKSQTPWNKGIKTGQIPPNKGKPNSEETRLKISIALKARYKEFPKQKKTPEQREKMKQVWVVRKANKK